MTDTTKPLSGIKVLDLTNVLAGPFCCHQLAHLGADVIKVEAPGRGDLARQLGADPALNEANMGASFLAQNAGKRSVTVNLKHDDGKAVLLRLVKDADVLVENFRPGVMDRLSLGPKVLRAENPALIYAAISGFGQDGPWRDRPAYDQIVQGVAGVMALTGTPDGEPLRVGYPVADTIGGLTAAMAITAALNAKPRGCVIDVSMMEAVLATMGWAVSNWLVAGIRPSRVGNENMTSAPSGAFRAADGPLNIAANRDSQWEALARHLGRADLLDRPDYASREMRKKNRHALRAELETVLQTRPAADWARELNAIGVPAGSVMDVPEALAHPQIADRGLVARFDEVPGVDRPVQTVRTAVKIDGTPPTVAAPPPGLGADTDDILAAAGYDSAQITALREGGAI
ncbi:CaiB/BaiF CoA transferase family protein [Aestuariibius sp. 2305UL40-4]|uniref:CaiB/BaiF CoA transferase family protein n=1 Tax=Aestuariibius violaceus TaxID=3234132 RepID=UPI00345EA567